VHDTIEKYIDLLIASERIIDILIKIGMTVGYPENASQSRHAARFIQG